MLQAGMETWLTLRQTDILGQSYHYSKRKRNNFYGFFFLHIGYLQPESSVHEKSFEFSRIWQPTIPYSNVQPTGGSLSSVIHRPTVSLCRQLYTCEFISPLRWDSVENYDTLIWRSDPLRNSVSFLCFTGISTFVDYIMPDLTLQKRNDTTQRKAERIRGFNTSPKGNTTAPLGRGLTRLKATVQGFCHYPTGAPTQLFLLAW